MRILLIHNQYQQPGGEDKVYSNELSLLREHGHEVFEYLISNKSISWNFNPLLAINTIWSHPSYKEIRKIVRRVRPQVVHFHNTLPIISPAGYYAARHEGVPVVQTLHNFRLFCPGSTFFRDGNVCEECLGKAFPWPGIVHKCYRKSSLATGVVASMLGFHGALGTWVKAVNTYIVLTNFAREKFIEGGLPAKNIIVKPNFSYSTTDLTARDSTDEYALFVGRLSPEKGIDTLLAAWEGIEKRLPLRIVGDGPLKDQVVKIANSSTSIEYLGWVEELEVNALMKNAKFLVLPSKWFEGFPMVIVEAYANGLPVIASNHGSLSSVIDHKRTGLLFTPNDSDDLTAMVDWALAHEDEFAQIRLAARKEFETKYCADQNYKLLIDIYKNAIEHSNEDSKNQI